MIVDALSAITYARQRANSYDEPITVYYIPFYNIYAFGKIGSLPAIQALYPDKQVIKFMEIDPETWNLDIEE